jgi:hypothetical protein
MRLFLLLCGAAAVAAIPLSLVGRTTLSLYVPWGEFLLRMEDASIKAAIFPFGTLHSYEPRLIELDLRPSSSLDDALAWGVFPTGRRVGPEMYFTLPLWMAAVLLLAWPVTSLLILRRRRKGQGFDVEARPRPLPPDVAPTPRSEEGGGGTEDGGSAPSGASSGSRMSGRPSR